LINLFKYTLGIIVLLTAAGCAIRVAPTGGAKDTKPPVLLKASPDTFSTNFSANTIEFEFDEYYQLNDLTNRLVISPPMEKAPIPKIKGKKLTLELQEPLKPNTTYNFNFGTAIADVNESNAMQDFRYVVSTGSYIDSLSATGTVNNAFTGAPEKDVTILLYGGTGDSLPYKEKPAYFAKTNDGGSYTLSYIAPGKYKIFAVKEANNNYLFDAEDEQVAFIDTLIDATKYPYVAFKLFKPERKKQKLLKKEFAMPGKLVLTFNKPVQNLKLSHLYSPADTGFYVTEYNKNRDSLTVWIKNIKTDSLRLVVFDDVAVDTLKLNNIRAIKKMGRGATPTKPDTTLGLSAANIQGGKLQRGNTLVLSLNHPADSVDFSKIKLFSDGLPITYTGTLDTETKRKITIVYPFSDEVSYKLKVEKNGAKDIFGFKNDSSSTAFTLRPERDYGTLALNLTLPEKGGNYVLQLLDNKGNVLKEQRVSQSQKVDYGLLEAGTYSYRLIDDVNNNGRWDTGNYLQHKQPEGVLYSSERPNVRGAWDLETEWDLGKPKGSPRGSIKGK
jgi:hypothetical protein